MKVIIAGTRTINPTIAEIETAVNVWEAKHKRTITEIVSGGARGVDAAGEIYAHKNGIPIERFIPDWKFHGKSAGVRRNKEMAKYADGLIIIWDGRSKGSNNMLRLAIKHKLFIHQVVRGE